MKYIFLFALFFLLSETAKSQNASEEIISNQVFYVQMAYHKGYRIVKFRKKIIVLYVKEKTNQSIKSD